MMGVKVIRTDDLAACLDIRFAVFVREQGVPAEEEQDARDATATHLLAMRDGQALGTARVYLEGKTGKIGRVAVRKEARGAGVGIALIRAGMDILRDMGATEAKLGAQTQAIGFYERLGFCAYGPVYDDAGIAHRDMVCPLDRP